MPLVRVEVLEGRSADEKRRLLDAVHDALVEAFGIPDDDRTQRLVEHEAAAFEIPQGAGDRYTLIEITAFPGRSGGDKRRLYEGIVRNLGDEGVPATDILIVLDGHPDPVERACGGQKLRSPL